MPSISPIISYTPKPPYTPSRPSPPSRPPYIPSLTPPYKPPKISPPIIPPTIYPVPRTSKRQETDILWRKKTRPIFSFKYKVYQKVLFPEDVLGFSVGRGGKKKGARRSRKPFSLKLPKGTRI